MFRSWNDDGLGPGAKIDPNIILIPGGKKSIRSKVQSPYPPNQPDGGYLDKVSMHDTMTSPQGLATTLVIIIALRTSILGFNSTNIRCHLPV